MSKEVLKRSELELSSLHIKFFKNKKVTLEEVVFLSTKQLKQELKKTTFSFEENKMLRKIRKRGREKWLHGRECDELGADIERLGTEVTMLRREKLQLEEEIEKLKIKCFLASDDSTSNSYM